MNNPQTRAQVEKQLDPKGRFVITEWYPKNSAEEKNGFSAFSIRDTKTNHVHVSIRGTDGIDIKDGKNDGSLALGRFPKQAGTPMVTFFERVLAEQKKNPTKDSKFLHIAGHSLGGALAQIASVMYRNVLADTWTVNAPSGGDLITNPEKYGKDSMVHKKILEYQKYTYGMPDPELEKNMNNIVWSRGGGLIVNMPIGRQIGGYRYIPVKIEVAPVIPEFRNIEVAYQEGGVREIVNKTIDALQRIFGAFNTHSVAKMQSIIEQKKA